MGKQAVVETVVVDVEAAVEEEAVEVAAGVEAVAASMPLTSSFVVEESRSSQSVGSSTG